MRYDGNFAGLECELRAGHDGRLRGGVWSAPGRPAVGGWSGCVKAATSRAENELESRSRARHERRKRAPGQRYCERVVASCRARGPGPSGVVSGAEREADAEASDTQAEARVVGDSERSGWPVRLDEAYLEAARVKNYSERTVENRESYLGFFIAWCEARSSCGRRK